MLRQLFISLPMLICFFWSIFFLLRFYRDGAEQRITGTIRLFYLATTVLYTDHWLYFSGHPSFIGEWTYLIANLSVYPLYYAYLRALTRTKIDYEVLLLLLPAAVVAILFPLNVPIHLAARICFAAQVIWVVIQGYRLIRHTQQRMDNTYTDDRSRLLRPAHILLYLFAITAAVSMILNVFGREFFTDSMLVCIPAVLMSILLFSLGYVAADTILPQETVEAVEPEEHNEPQTTEQTDELMHLISVVLREQRLFSNPNMTIQDLAQAVNSNRTYVSQCINRRTGLTFSQYIIRYRVEYAQSVLCDPSYQTDHEAVEAAMNLSGFTSIQTFYRVFKEVSGKTPVKYRKDHL